MRSITVVPLFARFLLGLVLSCVGAIQGCSAFAPRVDDLRFVSVALTDFKDQNEIDWPSTDRPRPVIALFKIEFETASNFQEIANDKGFFLSSEVSFCENMSDEHKPNFSNIGGIYYEGHALSKKIEGGQDINDKHKNSYRYYIFVPVLQHDRQTPYAGGINVAIEYDLTNTSKNLCVKIHGGKMLGAYFDSNIFSVPNTEISKAITSNSH